MELFSVNMVVHLLFDFIRILHLSYPVHLPKDNEDIYNQERSPTQSII